MDRSFEIIVIQNSQLSFVNQEFGTFVSFQFVPLSELVKEEEFFSMVAREYFV